MGIGIGSKGERNIKQFNSIFIRNKNIVTFNMTFTCHTRLYHSGITYPCLFVKVLPFTFLNLV